MRGKRERKKKERKKERKKEGRRRRRAGKKVVAVPDAAAVRSVRTCFILAAECDVILQPAPGALQAPSKARLFLSVL